jgi:hypothetical protein
VAQARRARGGQGGSRADPDRPDVGVAPELRRARARRHPPRDPARDPHVLLPARRGRDAFWIFFAAYIVLLTTGKSPKSLALARVGAALFGVVLLAFASFVVPDRVLFSFGIVILFIGIGLSPPYPIVGGGLTTIGAILLAGAPTGDIAGWAGHRLIDTVVGCAIAVAATYLLWPRDRETTETVPAPVT